MPSKQQSSLFSQRQETGIDKLTVLNEDQTGQNPEHEAIRQDLLIQLEIAKQQLQSQINFLIAQQIDSEHTDSIDHLRVEFARYDALVNSVRFSHSNQLPDLSHVVGHQVAQTTQTITKISGKASLQSSHILMEMTAEQIHDLQLKHDKQTMEFRAYEQQSFRRIEQLAKQNGIDISAFQENREHILGERDNALSNGDRTGVFKQDALLAINNYHGMGKVGGSLQEIEEARKKAQEAVQRSIKEAQIQAMREGQKKGLSGEQLQQHMEKRTDEFIENELKPEQEGLRKTNNPPSELEKLKLDTRIYHRAERYKNFGNQHEASLENATQVGFKGNLVMASRSIILNQEQSDKAEIGNISAPKDLPNTRVQKKHENNASIEF